METEERGERITWRTVRNTVGERILERSKEHNQAPTRRLRRRTKVLNLAMKRYSGIRSYSRYVKMKTSVLRHISDDSDTDDSGDYSDEDYATLHKSHLQRKESRTEETPALMDLAIEEEPNVGSQIAGTENVTTVAATSRKKPQRRPRSLNLGWQDVKKKVNNARDERNDRSSESLPVVAKANAKKPARTTKSVGASVSGAKVRRNRPEQRLSEPVNKTLAVLRKGSANSSDLEDEKPLLLRLSLYDDKRARKVNRNPAAGEQQSSGVSAGKDTKVNAIKRNLTKALDHAERTNEIGNSSIEKESPNGTTCTEERSVSPIRLSLVDSCSAFWDRSQPDRATKEEPPTGANHPKDSGIDDDSQEELSEDGKNETKPEAASNEVWEQEEGKASHGPCNESILVVSNVPASETTMEETEAKNIEQETDVKETEEEPDVKNTVQEPDVKNTVEEADLKNTEEEAGVKCTEQEDIKVETEAEDAGSVETEPSDLPEAKEEIQRPKTHPKVMCTEIVNQKYKIVPGDYQSHAVSIIKQEETDPSKNPVESLDDIKMAAGPIATRDPMKYEEDSNQTERSFTLQLDSSVSNDEKEDSSSSEEEEGSRINETTFIDKNQILANSTAIPKEGESDSEDEEEDSTEETVKPEGTSTRRTLNKKDSEEEEEKPRSKLNKEDSDSEEEEERSRSKFSTKDSDSEEEEKPRSKFSTKDSDSEEEEERPRSKFAKKDSDSEEEEERSRSKFDKDSDSGEKEEERPRSKFDKKGSDSEVERLKPGSRFDNEDSNSSESSLEVKTEKPEEDGTLDAVVPGDKNSTDSSDQEVPVDERSPIKLEANTVRLDAEDTEESLWMMETDETIDNSMSAFSKKRLQQLKRLNLIVGSESSSSEDESVRPTPKFRRKRERKSSSVLSDVQEPGTGQATKRKRRQSTGNPYLSDSDECDESKERISSDESSPEKKKQIGPAENKNNANNDTDSPDSSPEKSRMTKGMVRSNTFEAEGTKEERMVRSNTFEAEGTKEERIVRSNTFEAEGTKEERMVRSNTFEAEGTPVRGALSSSTPKPARRKRPENLQELIEEEDLMEETNDPGFSYNDLGEEEIYLIEVPSTILETELVGKRIVLGEKKLKIGKRKYQVSRKNVDSVSCLFATGKHRKPYKLVNVKPVASIIAQARLGSTSDEPEARKKIETVDDPPGRGKSSTKRKRRKSEREADSETNEWKRHKFHEDVD